MNRTLDITLNSRHVIMNSYDTDFYLHFVTHDVQNHSQVMLLLFLATFVIRCQLFVTAIRDNV